MIAYQYKPLKHPDYQVRLLQLQPGRGTVRCRLTTTSLDDAQDYEPLSYCWGPHENLEKIMLDNKAGFPVGRNLYAALKRLRLDDAVRILWVDAICIDQADIREKNAQIPLMGRIFERGLRTIVWLGEHDHQTGRAFRDIEALAGLYPRSAEELVFCARVQEMTRPQGLLGSVPGSLVSFAHFIQRELSQRARLSVLRRPWFSRVWIIQEVAVSTDVLVVCGKYSTRWDTIEKAYQVTKDDWDDEGSLRSLLDQRRVFQKFGRLHDTTGVNGDTYEDGPQTLERLLWKSFPRKATDVRDRVFAILGLVTSRVEQLGDIKVDYAADPDVLFWEVTRSCLESADDANLLSIAGGCNPEHVRFSRRGGGGTGTGIPTWSWIPDSDNKNPMHRMQFLWREYLKATPVPKAGMRFSDDGKLLKLCGYVVDTIEDVGPVFEEWRDENGISLSKWWDQSIHCFLESRRIAGVDEEGTYPGTGVPRKDAFHRCLLSMDSAKSQSDYDSALAKSKLFEDIVVDNFGKFNGDGGLLSVPTWAILTKLLFKFVTGDTDLGAAEIIARWLLGNRCVIRTAGGFIGMVPRYTKAGDVVALVKGARVPMVLRPAGERWKFVGECYVEGFMYGEVWEEARCDAVWVE